MATDWRRWALAGEFALEGDSVRVTFLDGRTQRVYVKQSLLDDSLRFWSIAARPAVVERLSEADLYAWKRNRGSDLVGFKIDRRGRLIGEVWLPAAWVTKEEWQLCVRLLAERCDRIEFLLTGKNLD